MKWRRSSRRFRASGIAIGFVLACAATTASLATAIEDRSPQLALAMAPYNAQALAGAAASSLQTRPSPAQVEKSRRMAQQALSREPLNAQALHTMGLTASMQGLSEARDFFGLASRVTKRSLPTQLWWIEQEAARGSIAGALKYHDQALRTSSRAAALLMPILVEASAQPPVATALASQLGQRPPYFRQFFIAATDTATDATGVQAIGRKVLDPTDPDDRDLINRIIARLGRDERFGDARETFLWASNQPARATVTNGNFDQPIPFGLFNWDLVGGDIMGEIGPRDGTNSLYLHGRDGSGMVVRQLLALPAGRYRLQAKTGNVPQLPIDRPKVAISCAESEQSILDAMPFPGPPGTQGQLEAVFALQKTCRFQWLTLSASAAAQDDARSWIDDITIRQIS